MRVSPLDKHSPAQGGGFNKKMPGRVCQESDNLPILDETFSSENIPILKGSSTQLYSFCLVLLNREL